MNEGVYICHPSYPLQLVGPFECITAAQDWIKNEWKVQIQTSIEQYFSPEEVEMFNNSPIAQTIIGGMLDLVYLDDHLFNIMLQSTGKTEDDVLFVTPEHQIAQLLERQEIRQIEIDVLKEHKNGETS